MKIEGDLTSKKEQVVKVIFGHDSIFDKINISQSEVEKQSIENEIKQAVKNIRSAYSFQDLYSEVRKIVYDLLEIDDEEIMRRELSSLLYTVDFIHEEESSPASKSALNVLENVILPRFNTLQQMTELAQINGERYALAHKSEDTSPSPNVLGFVYEEWEKPRGEVNYGLNQALTNSEIDSLKNNRDDIIAVCAYKLHDNKYKDILGNGQIDIILVKKEYRTRSGIGSFLTKRAIEKIIKSSESEEGFVPPAIIKADADTEEGAQLMKKMQEEYGSRVQFEVEERYKDDYGEEEDE